MTAVAHLVLRITHSYLLDSYIRLEERDIDGARPRLHGPDKLRARRDKGAFKTARIFKIITLRGIYYV